MDLNKTTVLITGAAGGLGTELALKCAEAGAELILLDKNRRGLTQLSDRITALGLPAPGLYPMDLAGVGVDDIGVLVDVIAAEYGGLDALVHCALEFDSLQPLEQIQPQDWLTSMQVNLNTPWLLSSKLLPLLRKSQRSSLIFLLDDLDDVSGAYWGAYGAAKAALAGLVRQFNDSLSNTAVQVFGVIPGPMRTDFRARVYHAENPLDQPSPTLVAGKIAKLISGQSASSGPIVDLSDS